MPYKLLLADDSVTIQRVIELTFADEDIQVVAVSDGDQAIARLDADPPDIVLADVGMPGRDGYEVAAYVKKTPRLAHIPVVLLTGAFEPVDQARADLAGCDGVLAKPFEPQLVIGRVKELLGQAGRATASLNATLDPVIHPAPQPATKASGDQYFDRLDAAFATLSNVSTVPAKPAASNAIADSIDWFTTKPSAAPADLPLSYGSPQADFAPAVPAPVPAPPVPAPPVSQAVRLEPALPHATAAAPVPVPGPAAPAASAPMPAPEHAPRPSLPPLADAFAALLAAEQSAPSPAAAPQWPMTPVTRGTPSPPQSAASPLALTDDLVEQVTRRVVERLSDRVVRETVSEVVSAVAERLVREEIERIKAAIK